jgi:hypothetical protein
MQIIRSLAILAILLLFTLALLALIVFVTAKQQSKHTHDRPAPVKIEMTRSGTLLAPPIKPADDDNSHHPLTLQTEPSENTLNFSTVIPK